MVESNWNRNEQQAAARLGLTAAVPKQEHSKVQVLDIELSDGSKVVLSILRNGWLSIQSYKGCSRGSQMWAFSGSALVDLADLKEWATTLWEATRHE